MDNYLPKYFKKNIKSALSYSDLRQNVRRATLHSLENRKKQIKNPVEWEQFRNQAYNIRKHTLEQLENYLTVFKEKAIEKGYNITSASNGHEACTIIESILKKYNIDTIVKSKSMVSEEINLNDYLERNNYKIFETDLGEFIVQIANEKPSHITAPAIHKSRHEIGKLFSEKLNIPYTHAPEELTEIARNYLRDKFLKAGAGITGANFLIAETGSILIIENEGNARLTITLPKIHIVIASIEKIVPSLKDALTLMKLLPISSTGQKITSYVSIINSKSFNTEPKDIYIILLDNGRSQILKNPETRKILYCIKCGACMSICPVYQTVGGHAYGSVYPGPIGAILTPYLQGLKRDSKDLPYGSTLCGACSDICPVKIDIHHFLLQLRKIFIQKSYSSLYEKFVFRLWLRIMNYFTLYKISEKILKLFRPLFKEKGLKIPIWSKYKYFPPPARKTFHDFWKELKFKENANNEY